LSIITHEARETEPTDGSILAAIEISAEALIIARRRARTARQKYNLAFLDKK
jgi:hypothetical protein